MCDTSGPSALLGTLAPPGSPRLPGLLDLGVEGASLDGSRRCGVFGFFPLFLLMMPLVL